MNSESLHPQNILLYGERDSVGVSLDIEILFSDPELNLSDEEKAQAQAFSEGLFKGKLSEDLKCESGLDLEKVYQTDANESCQKFYLGYFATEKGIEDLGRFNFSNDERPLSVKLNDVELINKRIDKKTRQTTAANSLNWYKDQLAARLLEDAYNDKDYKDEKPLIVNYDPDKLLGKIDALQDYRRFYRQVRGYIKAESETELRQAKEIILGLYRARVNNLIAEHYHRGFELVEQLNRGDPSQNKDWIYRLSEALPTVRNTFLQNREDKLYSLEELTGRFTRRLDFLRNGAAWQNDRELSPISVELAQLAKELSEHKPEVVSEASPLSPEVIQRLDETKWQAPQVKSLAEAVLGELNLLSTQTNSWTEAKSRSGFPDDKKWQIIINPEKTSLSVDSSKRVVWVPEDFDRSLTQESPAGALIGLAHELTHVLQAEFDYQLGETIPLAKIKGRRCSTIREVGPIHQEAKMQGIFGRDRPVNLYFLRALEAKLSGASKMEVVRAYYNSYVAGKQIDEKEDKEARKQAADRALRLYRFGGSNTQPLDYVEQELYLRHLQGYPESQVAGLLVACSSFSLKDAARLHQADLLTLPENLAVHPYQEVWRIFTERFLPEILKK